MCRRNQAQASLDHATENTRVKVLRTVSSSPTCFNLLSFNRPAVGTVWQGRGIYRWSTRTSPDRWSSCGRTRIPDDLHHPPWTASWESHSDDCVEQSNRVLTHQNASFVWLGHERWRLTSTSRTSAESDWARADQHTYSGFTFSHRTTPPRE